MLERLAAYFLNTYVAEYVGNVVTDQLTIGWRGESIVQLQLSRMNLECPRGGSVGAHQLE